MHADFLKSVEFPDRPSAPCMQGPSAGWLPYRPIYSYSREVGGAPGWIVALTPPGRLRLCIKIGVGGMHAGGGGSACRVMSPLFYRGSFRRELAPYAQLFVPSYLHTFAALHLTGFAADSCDR
jgi:hypothetical protein